MGSRQDQVIKNEELVWISCSTAKGIRQHLAAMMIVWTLLIRHHRKTMRSAEKLAELDRKVREAEQEELDSED